MKIRGGLPGSLTLTELAMKPQDVLEEAGMDFTLEELRDFLEGDIAELEADPEFKERLRQQLWELVLSQSGPPREDD